MLIWNTHLFSYNILISFALQYSDQDETERASILEKFRLATLQWNQKYSALSLDSMEPEHATRKSCVVVATDACLPSSALGEASLTARLLINYELPTKKVKTRNSFMQARMYSLLLFLYMVMDD